MRPVLTNLEDAEVVDRMEVAIARALDAAQRAEGLGERDIFLSGWGVISTTDLATAFRLRAERIKADLDRFVALVVSRVEAAADAVAAVGEPATAAEQQDDEESTAEAQPPRRGRAPS